MSRLVGLLAVMAGVGSAFADWTALYDSHGFTSAPLGSANQLPGWSVWGDTTAGEGQPPGLTPQIVDRPDGNRCMQFEVPDSQGACSRAILFFPAPVDTSHGKLRVEFDLFRQPDASICEFEWLTLTGQGSETLPICGQFDPGTGQSVTMPVGWYGPWFGTGPGHWTSVSITFDFDTLLATGVYRGFLSGTVSFVRPPPLRLFMMDQVHLEGTGLGPDALWVDNLRILTPEPSTLAGFVVLGALARLRRRRWGARPCVPE